MTRTGRPRSFDEDTALQAAMTAFWEGGYTGTTYRDLEQATGLRRQSLTYAFGEKPDLFRRALALYIDQRVRKACALLAQDAPFRDNLSALLNAWEADASSGNGHGCLLVRATAEVGLDPHMTSEIRRGDTLLLQALTQAFDRAQLAGEVPSAAPPEALARLVISVGNGAMTQAVARQDPEVSRAAHDALLSLLT
ncbi:TetR/AcrR family transcriptional regulator [Tritonibacter mobilis]|uniref:TetR/AcrR family transcriptional regulator n=1 Tax=Tritonibacter mobilis TaxID=379347 RepID=UPI003A5C0908